MEFWMRAFFRTKYSKNNVDLYYTFSMVGVQRVPYSQLILYKHSLTCFGIEVAFSVSAAKGCLQKMYSR
jgi:hypothetical protein